MSDLHNRLVHWATTAPDRLSIVEAETGRGLTYVECLAAVQQMRHFLGGAPLNLTLSTSGGLVDAVLWLTALTGGHTLSPLAPDAAEEEQARSARMFPPNVL